MPRTTCIWIGNHIVHITAALDALGATDDLLTAQHKADLDGEWLESLHPL
jgi:hypothetical protein